METEPAEAQVFPGEGKDEGYVGLMLYGASVLEDSEGKLVPGIRFTPEQAREVARVLIETADELEKPD